MRKGKREHSEFYSAQSPFKAIEGVDTWPFMRLSPCSVWVLTRFYCKWDGKIKNRTNLSLTYKEIRDTMSGVVFLRSIWELIGYGFLDVRRFGRLERNASLYALSSRWRSLNDPEKCGDIENTLREIRNLQRERSVSGKRAQLSALRHRLLGRTNA